MSLINWSDFENVEIRVGTIIRVEDFPEAKKSAYKVWVDFGEHGIKQSSAQITRLYRKEDLMGKQVVCVLNFPPNNIAGFMSQILITGFVLENGDVVINQPERKVPNGLRLA